MKHFKLVRKGTGIVVHRLRAQGLRVTLIWIYVRVLTRFNGLPMLRYSKITPQIYVGGQYGTTGKEKLEAEGIHYGVNMRIEFDDAANDLALDHYCYLPTIDEDAPSIEHLKEGVAFIKDAMENSGKVYIHCAAGVGRAPTMATAYFISEGMSMDDAIAKIAEVRPFIDITPPQRRQLRRFEAIYRALSDTDEAKIHE